jgi:nucleoside-diphosphate-sugar epimerase
MKILFIGGSGNISADCAALLHQRGHQITVLTRGRSPVPAEYRAVRADRNDLPGMRAALAGVAPDVAVNFIGFEPADVQTDFELFAGRVGHYIFISSATVYAKPHRQLPLTESAPLGNAFWEYARKKQRCEEWLLEKWHSADFPVSIVRPSHTYGPRWIPNVVASAGYTLAARLQAGKPVFVPDDGETLWTLTATSDFALGFAGLVGNARAIGETFHITSDEALTWNQIYSEIAAALGVASPDIARIPTDWICERFPQLTGPLKGDKAHPAVFDNSKIKRFVPGFECRKPFRDGIREAVAWFRQHPDRQTVNADADALFERVVAAWRAKKS